MKDDKEVDTYRNKKNIYGNCLLERETKNKFKYKAKERIKWTKGMYSN